MQTPAGLTREQFPAMGTTVEVLLPAREAAAVERVRTLFAEWEQVLSRFRPESELSRLNAQAGTPVPVSALLYEVLATALQAARATEGIYDPTLLLALTQLGYDRTFEELPAARAAVKAPPLLGGSWRWIALDPATRRVTLPAGVGLDFGGIAKGMAVDAATAALAEAGLACAVVNAGGDLAVHGLPPSGEPWPIAVPSRHAQWTVAIRDGALATSGIARRRWRQGTEVRHHLVDPRTGMPATTGLWSVTAAARTCAQAEVAAKVALILGPRRGAAFLQAHDLAAVLIHEDGRTTPVGEWPHAADPADVEMEHVL